MIDDFDIPEWINPPSIASLAECNRILSPADQVCIENAAFMEHNKRYERAKYWRDQANYL